VLALPFTVAENAKVWPVVSPPRLGEIATVVEPAVAIVIVADALLVVSATDVAFSVTVAGDGTDAGAVYVIAALEALLDVDNVPQAVPLQPAPFSAHITPLFCESFVTVAVKFCVLPALTVADVGETLTPTGAVTVIAAVELFVVSATDVAFSVTAAGLGTLAGALYVTDVVVTFVSVPHVAPLHPVPDSDHVTPLFPVSFVNAAVKFCWPIPDCTFFEIGEIVIEITGAVVTVMVAVSDFVLSAAEAAFSVTAPPGAVAGAV